MRAAAPTDRGNHSFPLFRRPRLSRPPNTPTSSAASARWFADRPVVKVVSDRGEQVERSDYGAYTGGVRNPEELFASFTARAAGGASSMRARSSYSTPVPPTPLPDARLSPP